MRSSGAWLVLWYALLGVAACVVLPRALPAASVPLYTLLAHAFQHPALLLDTWAGPLFTLMAAPWAAWGEAGLRLFGLLCFGATAWCAGLTLRPKAPAAAALLPLLLLTAPGYREALVAGTHEPFFGLLCMATLAALRARRTGWAALFSALMPLVRAEGLVVMPFVALWIAGLRRWSALPVLALGVLFRVLLEWPNGPGAPLLAERVAGRAAPLALIGPLADELGGVLVVLWLTAVVLGAVWWALRAGERSGLRWTLVMVALPVLAVATLHGALAWWGVVIPAAGPRVGAVITPLCALVVAQVGTQVVEDMLHHPAARVAVAVLVGAGALGWSAGSFPQQAHAERIGLQERLQDVVARGPVHAINDPIWAHRFGVDPWRIWAVARGEEEWALDPGERVLWMDTWSGPPHLRTPVDVLLGDERLRVEGLAHFAPAVYDSLPPVTIWSFAAGPEMRYRDTVVVFRGTGHEAITYRLDLSSDAPQHRGRPCFAGTEFPMEFAELPVNAPEFHATEVIVRGTAVADGRRLELVISEDGPGGRVGYWKYDLWSGPFTWRLALPARPPDVRTKLYIWDQAQQPFCITDLEVLLIRTYRGRP